LAATLRADVLVAQPADEHEEDLRKIKVQVSAAEGELRSLTAEFDDLVKQRKAAEGELTKLKDEQRRAVERGRELARDRERLEARVAEAEERLVRERERATARLRVLYMTSGSALPTDLVWRVAAAERERTAVYIRSIRRSDGVRLAGLGAAVDTLAEERRKLDETSAAQEQLLNEVRERQKGVESQAQRLKGMVDQIAQKRKAAERTLAKLRAEATRLDKLIESLTSRDSPPESAPAGSAAIDPGPAAPETEKVTQDTGPTEGGLFAKGVSVGAPVKGKVLQPFGKVKVTSFSDMIFSKGFEYAAAPASTVHAVHPGKVVYDARIRDGSGGRSRRSKLFPLRAPRRQLG
jgi:septal ring factor EnvC (AmiA/AmiB activator)